MGIAEFERCLSGDARSDSHRDRGITGTLGCRDPGRPRALVLFSGDRAVRDGDDELSGGDRCARAHPSCAGLAKLGRDTPASGSVDDAIPHPDSFEGDEHRVLVPLQSTALSERQGALDSSLLSG